MSNQPTCGILAGEPEVIGERCADGGKCHHRCEAECSRRTSCAPLTGSGLMDDWSDPKQLAMQTPAGCLLMDKSEVEFLAARVRRLCAKFSYHCPNGDDGFVVGVAGSLIGGILTNLELAEREKPVPDMRAAFEELHAKPNHLDLTPSMYRPTEQYFHGETNGAWFAFMKGAEWQRAQLAAAPQPASCSRCDGFAAGCEECSGLGSRAAEQLASLRRQADAAHRAATALGLGAGFDVTQLAEVIAERLAAPLPGVTEAAREQVYEAVAEALGDAYDCLRVWSAWGVGTMGPDDFARVADDVCRVTEIADAAINVLLAAAPQPEGGA